VLGSSAVELGSSAHTLERTRPRIDRTPAIARTTANLKRICSRAHTLVIERTRGCIVRQVPFDSLNLCFSLLIRLGD
jgi:hypothetical protein